MIRLVMAVLLWVVFTLLTLLTMPAAAHAACEQIITRYPLHTQFQYTKTFIDNQRSGNAWRVELYVYNPLSTSKGFNTTLLSCGFSGTIAPHTWKQHTCTIPESRPVGTYTASQYGLNNGLQFRALICQTSVSGLQTSWEGPGNDSEQADQDATSGDTSDSGSESGEAGNEDGEET